MSGGDAAPGDDEAADQQQSKVPGLGAHMDTYFVVSTKL